MSSFGTEKFPTTSLRLGMPSAFQNAYARFGQPEQFAPAPAPHGLNITVGDDFQAHWHQQKKADADHMVRAKVDATRMMYNRSNSSPHGVYGMPQPVLGQRQFANPSHGALQSGSSTRQDYASAPFHYAEAHGLAGAGHLVGGVLRTAQGQAFGMTLLQKRIAEFDNIAKLASEYKGQTPSTEGEASLSQGKTQGSVGQLTRTSQQLGLVPLVELSQLLQGLLSALADNDVSRLTQQDSVRSLSLIVRLATTGEADDIQDILEFIEGGSSGDGLLPKLEELTIRPIEDEPRKSENLLLSLKEFWERVKVYLNNMLKTVGQPAKSRSLASQTYLKSLKFSKLFTGKLPAEFVSNQDAQQALDDRSLQIDDDRFDGPPPGWQGQSTPSSRSSVSDRPPPASGLTRGQRGVVRREDSQHGYRGDGGQEFSFDDRERFAYASGEFPTGGRPVEESPEEEEGEEDFTAMATGTIPTNDGPRLVNKGKNAITGEADVEAVRPEAPAPAPAQPARPSWLSREKLSGLDRDGFARLARKVNAYYNNSLPDGKGIISVSAYGKPKSIRTNFIKRLLL